MAFSADELVRRQQQLEAARANWDSHWERVAEVVWPDAREFISRTEPGERRTRNLYDATAALALEKFAAALESLMTPREQTWHRLKADDDALNNVPSIQRWFDEVNRRLFSARNDPRAAFYAQMHETYKSLGAFGNATVYVESGENGRGVRYKYCHPAQIYAQVDNFHRVDVIFRKYPLTAKAAAQKWGLEALEGRAPKVFNALIEKPFSEHTFLHVVAPRDHVDPLALGPARMPYVSYDVSVGDREIIEEGGFFEFPYLFGRYTVNPYEVYGRGPAMLILPDILTLQDMEKVFLQSGHKVADPPLLVHDDGVIGSGSNPIVMRPGAVNYGGLDEQGRQLIQPFLTGARLDITETMLDKKREVVNDAFLVTLFQILVDQPNMTATEALLRAQEKGQLIAPTIGRQQSEILGPLIDRELHLLMRQGELPELPAELIEAAGDYDIIYDSPATRLARSEEIVGIQRTLEMALPLAEFQPEVMLLFKMDEGIRRVAEINGVPSIMIRTEDELAEAKEAFEQKQQMAQALEVAPGIAGAAKDLTDAQVTAQEATSEPGGAAAGQA